ncbi:MAG: DUF1727 domain-containing protein [Clostridia bacterium]|nr:DUF1727 domain-containing protein [Clostridia bacterium]
MGKLRFYIALFAAKAAQGLMKLLGRNATYLPGKVALKFSKDFLKYLTLPKTVIAVTGTNGKTTTSNLLNTVLTANGYSVTNNSFGSNVQAGIIAALINDSTWLGKAKKDIAVLEVDERSSLLIYPFIRVDYLVCNNLMRDSLKRNAHTEFIQYIINRALSEDTTLVVNADDLNTVTLGVPEQKRVFFGVEAEQPETSNLKAARDIVYCPKCGALLEAEYLRYNHIGRLRCPSCDLKSPTPDYAVVAIDRDNDTFTVRHHGRDEVFTLINDNIVNVYNFCGVIAVLNEIGIPYEQIAAGFAGSQIVKSRFDEVQAGDLHITMLMAKGQNPIACARCFDYAAKAPYDDKGLAIFVDDKSDNINESESTCWLYDCDYTPLADESIKQIVFAGPRCRDHLLRARLAGVPAEKLVTVDDSARGHEALDTDRCKHVFIMNDLTRPAEAQAVKNALVARAMGGAAQ